jgi:hypothetical protein
MSHHLQLEAISTEMEKCIQECLDCYSQCMNTVMHCLKMGAKHSEPNHIKTLLDCASICRTAADFMLRNSLQHRKICRICAEVCNSCAQSCEQIGGSDQMMKCAEICKSCQESCEKISRS